MSKIETVRIKRLGGFIIINKCDFDPARHEIYGEPKPKKEFAPAPSPPPVPAEPEPTVDEAVLSAAPAEQEVDVGQTISAADDAGDAIGEPQEAAPQAKPARKAPKKKGASKKKK